MILAWVVAHVTGEPLDRYVTRKIYDPMGVKDLFFPGLRSGIDDSEFAATELCRWRDRLLKGQVHDDNAFVVGGVDGQAGLFGTAQGVYRFLSILMGGYAGGSTGVFQPRQIRFLFEKHPGVHRTPGFDTPDNQGSSAGTHFSKQSIGHLGFTGTSFWVDLLKGIQVILLTNRVHPSRDDERIKAFRPDLHNAVMESMR
jgi:CubicO group peptidase (beta-lactamase class C family)